MYTGSSSVQASALPVTGIGTASMYAVSGPEAAAYTVLAAFTLYAAIRTIWKLMPRFGS